jgi:phage terminase large subunit-like protein
MIQKKWLRYYDDEVQSNSNDTAIVTWDTASKSSERFDYSVGTVLLDLVRERLDFPVLKRRAIALHQRWSRRASLIEDKGSGT